MNEPTIAAIDLGSNSFHLLIGRVVDDHLQVIDRVKDMVQLADGLDSQRRLEKPARERALTCLARFGERLRQIPPQRVRAVGTNTLRQARNSRSFLAKAEKALGHPVEIISGIEEARLIYLGVSHASATITGRRLVMDIGGGSTELIIGEKFEPIKMESLFIGCVSNAKQFFPEQDRPPLALELQAAGVAARLELQPVLAGYRSLGWDVASGASGTIKAVHDVIVSEGWSRDGITAEALQRLHKQLLLTSPAQMSSRWKLSPRRAAVFCGGFSVLRALVEELGISRLQLSDGALREGVVYDLLGRSQQEDVRDRTIGMLSRRYAVDQSHALRVVATTERLLAQASQPWELGQERFARALRWAATLHECGLAVAHSQYHKHGAYVLRNADLPGFSRSEQALLAALVRGHRRKFPLAEFASLPTKLGGKAMRCCVLLRLAVLLHRSRGEEPMPVTLKLTIKGQNIRISAPPDWLCRHPLTRADLSAEVQFLQKAGFKLSVV